ncbi:MAG: hypothetical protein JSU05_13255, partial [Bacteroidetes bacterium]|nr:hypothetical protein [Bacteroidota bacterium]
MKKFLLFAIVVVSYLFSSAQPYDPAKVNPKAIQFYNQALERTQDGNYAAAAGLLLQAIKTD